MNKQTALWVLIGGAGLSIYDMLTTEKGANGGNLYGTGKPLEKLRFQVWENDAKTKQYYVSVSDAAAVLGAWFYFR